MEIQEIFENLIKIEPKVTSIESLFNNPDRRNKTDYRPSYQRNYVWDDEKATYFIESILMGTEIPPLIFFKNPGKFEIIDGRQRYETILRFINNDFKLRENGLSKLKDIGIANKYFKGIGDKLKDLFWDTKLRIIEFSLNSKVVDLEIEEVVKKEIFKRYNSGITPLKSEEIDKAAYYQDDLNTYFKNKLLSDQILYNDIQSLLHFEKSSLEIILKKIRQLIVQHQIPIKYYSIKKDNVISKYYDILSERIDDEKIEDLYSKFIQKINLLKRIRELLISKNIVYNRLITECLFWAFSIVEVEHGNLTEISEAFLISLSEYLAEHSDIFQLVRSSFFNVLNNRYNITSQFFSNSLKIDFQLYLQNNQEFKQKNKSLVSSTKGNTSFEDLRINKPEPSSITIVDICRQMERQRFLIRPPYQRNEVINKKKSSSIIESILLGIKVPPIFVFRREDGVSEVLDGQQRLLSILGFIEKPYLNEKNEKSYSDKNGYSLSLKNGILKGLDGRKHKQLSQFEKDQINNFDLWIIEISQKNNQNFEPIDLFIRLNNKPYPIKEDTFEMWNSYISKDIIDTIKSIHKNNKDWFYFRKNNSRMEDENVYTALIYFTYSVLKKGRNDLSISNDIDIYKVNDKINFRVKSKNEISRVLEDADEKDDFISACNQFEFDFLTKLKHLIADNIESPETSSLILNKNLDYIFNIEKGRRTQQSFYALWTFLFEIPYKMIVQNKIEIRNELRELFVKMSGVETKNIFDEAVIKFRNKFSTLDNFPTFSLPYLNGLVNAKLGSIAYISQGFNISDFDKTQKNNKDSFPVFKKIVKTKYCVQDDPDAYIALNDTEEIKDIVERRPKIFFNKSLELSDRLIVAYSDEKILPGIDSFYCVPVRKGFSPKFIYAILSSKLLYYMCWQARIDSNSNIKSLNLSILKELPIPNLSPSVQMKFERMISIVEHLAKSGLDYSFFERLIDAMVYELYFPTLISSYNCNVIEFLGDIPFVENVNNAQSLIENYYKQISKPNSSINASLLKLLNITELSTIENRYEKNNKNRI